MSLVDGVRDAIVATAIGRQAGASRRAAAVRRAAAALPPGQQQVLQQLLGRLYTAISLEGPDTPWGKGVPDAAPLWQAACLAYLGTCSEAQLQGWRWSVQEGNDSVENRSAEVEFLPYLLHGSRHAIRKVHFDLLREHEKAYEEELQLDPIEMDDYGYGQGFEELMFQAYEDFSDSMRLRDRLLRPLLEAAVRAGAAPLPLATVQALNAERQAQWGGAGAAWADSWEPAAEVHARFHPRFRAAVRTLLLANHRGLPGTDCNGGPIHLPSDVLLNVVRGMAAPEAEAAWVPLAGPLPAWIDLNSDSTTMYYA